MYELHIEPKIALIRYKIVEKWNVAQLSSSSQKEIIDSLQWISAVRQLKFIKQIEKFESFRHLKAASKVQNDLWRWAERNADQASFVGAGTAWHSMWNKIMNINAYLDEDVSISRDFRR